MGGIGKTTLARKTHDHLPIRDKVAMYADSNSPHHMTILNLDNSWKLLCEKVFRPEHDHPLELEEIGKEIARKFQGLPEDFRCCGKLPASMSELQNLQTLIIRMDRYNDITSPGNIWMMRKSRHIHRRILFS
ncbi:hypothetical protein KY289_023260 [Solanum tuberosum]|nr:hypothetical protein KY289_023260 [Solanum tuberosum]